MFQPFLIADAPPASWLGVVYGFGSAAGLALVTWLLSRLSKRNDDAAAAQRRLRDGDATVETENIRSLRDLQEQRNKDMAAMRAELEKVKDAAEKKIDRLDRKVTILTTAYYALHSALMVFRQGWRTMRARLKRLDPNFDEAEYIEPDVEGLDPMKLFQQLDRTTSVTVISSPSNPANTTTVTTTEGGPPTDGN